MASGNANDSVFYGNLQRSISGVIAQSKLVGQFPDPYYGDLKVYEFNAH
jgi:hypothetical protein